MVVKRVRCGVCDVENDCETAMMEVGDGFECGWCSGLSRVAHVGPLATTERRAPDEAPPRMIWLGYAESFDAAVRNARRAQLDRFSS